MDPKVESVHAKSAQPKPSIGQGAGQDPAASNDTDTTPQEQGDSALDGRLKKLQARLRARGLQMEAVESGDPTTAPPLSDAARERLTAFTKPQIEGIEKRLGPVKVAPWPDIDGCLGVLFTSRTGSSYLARELATRFRIGRMEESLNPHLIEGVPPADVVRSYADGWFSFKLGVPGILSAELSGVVDQYIDRTYFIFLLRKDIIGQAISLVKANQTGQWHSIHAPQRDPEYDGAKLATSVRIIANAVASLRAYIERAERPWRRLFYEDFEHGDFSTAEAICGDFHVPRIEAGAGPKFTPLERTADEVNESWAVRFLDEMDSKTREVIEKYRAAL